MIARIRNFLINRLSPIILGRHPRNRIFSFNYFNVAHICRFLTARAATLPDGSAVFLDVGAGQSPYRPFFTGKFGRYLAVDVPDCLPSQAVPGIEHFAGTAEKSRSRTRAWMWRCSTRCWNTSSILTNRCAKFSVCSSRVG